MEAEKQQDPPTASQKPKFPNSPPPRESEIFLDSNNEHFSSSEATGIDSPCSVDHPTLEEEDVTPPEHTHLSDHNQNALELCVAEATEARISEVGLDDELDGCILPFVDSEIKVGEAKFIVLGSSPDEIIATLDAADVATRVSIVRQVCGLLCDFIAVHGNKGILDSNSGEIAKLKRIAGKNFKPPKAAKKPKESHVSSGRNRVEEIDEFGYDETIGGRTGRHAGGSGSKRPSLMGEREEVVKTSVPLDLLEIFKTAFGGTYGGCDCDEDVDIIEIAKKKGMVFPRPSWWPDGDEEGYAS